MSNLRTAFPAGHFYSPVVDPGELLPSRIWPADPQVLGIDFNDASHIQILAEHFPRYHPLYDYAETGEETPALRQFFTDNSQFGWLDSRTLFVLLHAWRPRRIVEVGSGFSSLLMADVNRRWFGSSIDVACIEPFPRAFLKSGIEGISRLVEAKVQDVPPDEFARLRDGDILFIDSSHVAKTGSDVNFLVFEVLPRLAPGVFVHVHDVFLPHDYAKEWVIDQNRSWNEQYVLRALLMYSTAFRVIFGSSYALHAHRTLLVSALAFPDGRSFAGGSFWFQRTA